MFPETLSNIRVYTGVQFRNDYKNIRKFKDINQQNSFFNARTVLKELQNCRVTKTANKFTIDIEINIELANKASYISFTNAKTGGKVYYAFIVGTKYSKIGTSTFQIELDFYQTYQFEFTLQESYVERQHGPISLIEDYINMGSEMITLKKIDLNVSPYMYMVIIAKEPLFGETEKVGSYVGTPSPLYHYVMAYSQVNNNGDVVVPYTFNKGGQNYVGFSYETLMFNIQTTWANKIVSNYMTPWAGINFSTTLGTEVVVGELQNSTGTNIEGAILFAKNIIKFDTISITYNALFANYPSGYDERLKNYPYTKVLLMDFNGNSLELKPEYITNQTDDTITIKVYGTCGVQNKLGYAIPNYGRWSLPGENDYNMMMIDNTPNSLPIMVDQYSAYIQGNNNSLMAQREVSANNWAVTNKNAFLSATSNVAGSAISGVGSIASNPLSFGNAVGSTANTTLQGVTGMEIADNIGENNFENLITQQNAMLSDLRAVPPSVSNMGANASFEYGNFKNGFRIIMKTPNPDEMQKISRYYDKFGYRYNQYMAVNQTSRSNFNYVKTLDCRVTGQLNQSILNGIQKIFNNGVFIWHTNAMVF